MEKIKWIQDNNLYSKIVGETKTIDKLPIGVYSIKVNRTSYNLEKLFDLFTFDYKIYDLQNDFIDYTIKTLQNTKGNFGLLLNGERGTGKTVTAKILVNRLNLPVIIMKNDFDESNVFEWLSQINSDCVFLFDEYEKNFGKSHSILSFMDGVYNSEYRKIFILTTNEVKVNENLLSRPSRIRYIKTFGNLSKTAINQYLEDNLKDKSLKSNIFSFVDTLTLSTIDILKAIVEEYNIHGIVAEEKLKEVFNVKYNSYFYNTMCTFFRLDKYNKYDIDDFIRDCELKAINIKEKASISKNDCNKIGEVNDKYLNECKQKVNESFLKLSKCFTEYKPHENIVVDDYNYSVVKVDVEKNVFVLYENNYYYFHQILNPNVKPSLYANFKF